MRVFVFFLMTLVSVGGLLAGYRAITGEDLVSLSDFGVGRSTAIAYQQPTTVPLPTVAPTAVPVPTIAAPPTAAPTAVAANPKLMVVANTDGIGVYLRKTPKLDDRLRPWVEGTRFEVLDNPVDGDGVKWLKVKGPDGIEGFIPSQFLVPAP